MDAEAFDLTTRRDSVRVTTSNKSLQPATTLSESSGEGSLQRNVNSFDCVMGPIAFPKIFATPPGLLPREVGYPLSEQILTLVLVRGIHCALSFAYVSGRRVSCRDVE